MVRGSVAMNTIRFTIPKDLRGAYDAAAADWTSNRKIDRLWRKDASLWTSGGEEKWLGWTDIAARQQNDLSAFTGLANEIKAAGFESAVLLGMGGSSLCPEVLSITFGTQTGFPAQHIVDSTDPAQIRSIREKVDLSRTLVIVASKSGSTLEPNILMRYFFEEMTEAVGADKGGSHFLTITDPGSQMEQAAKSMGFRKILYGDAQIGGRYSALSNFGVVPAAIAGLDVSRLLAEAAKARKSAESWLEQNPAVQLGLLLGVAHNAGRDKLTIFTSPEIHDFSAWLEQLVAESTGKHGKGITPVDREPIGAPAVYGSDRVFVYVRVANTADASQDRAVAALEAAGHPVVRIELNEIYEIFGQFFLWEVATAVAGSVMGINPFDQPDVEAAKVEARKIMAAYEETGRLPYRKPMFADEDLLLFASDEYAARLKADGPGASLGTYLRAHLGELRTGDYFAILAFLPMFSEHEAVMQGFRHRIRDMKRVATCLGFGPRFLHSTGQDYKGGPNSGVFLQITCAHERDLAIPGQKYSFGTVIDAQAAGDMAVLEARGRRMLRVHLGRDVAAGLAKLSRAVDHALEYQAIR